MYLSPGSMLIALLFMLLGLVTDVCQSRIIIECESNAIEFIGDGYPNIDGSDDDSVELTIYFNDSYIIAGFIISDADKWEDSEADITFYDNNETFSHVDYRYIELHQDNFKIVLFKEKVVADKVQVYCHLKKADRNSSGNGYIKKMLDDTKLNFFGCTYSNASSADNEVEETKSITSSYTEALSSVQSPYYSPASPVCLSPTVTAPCPSPTIDILCQSPIITSDTAEATSFLSDSKAFFGIIIPVVVMFVVNLVAFFALLATFIWRNRKNKTSKHNQTRTLREVPNESLYAMSSFEEDKVDSKSNGNNEDIYTPVLSTPRMLGMVDQPSMVQGEESCVNEDLQASHTFPRPALEAASPYTLPVSTKKRSLQLVLNSMDNREYCEVAPRARSNSWTEQDLKNQLRKMNEKDESSLDVGQGTADIVKAYLQQTL